jgi:hypothetical protein
MTAHDRVTIGPVDLRHRSIIGTVDRQDWGSQ